MCVDYAWSGYLPVDNVEESVETEHGHVVGGQVLNDADLLEHNNLGDEGNRLKPEGVGPDDFPGRSSRVA